MPASPTAYRSSIAIVFTLTILAERAVSQCNDVWLPGEGITGADHDVLATVVWDPDGPGPLGEHVVFGGRFAAVGDVVADHVVLWDPATGACSQLGSGFDGDVRALVVLPTGVLVAGGAFRNSGGIAVGGAAYWTGAVWQPLGAGLPCTVTDFAALPNGDLAAASSTVPGGVWRWDGAAWTPIGTGLDTTVEALAVLPNGDLIAGGGFVTAGGAVCDHLARWNGAIWAPFVAGLAGASATIHDLLTMPNGDLVAAGEFTSIGGIAALRIARWNGTAWTSLGVGFAGPAFALAARPNGDLFAGGLGAPAGAGSLALWSGGSWSPVPAGAPAPLARTIAVLANGDLAVGGTFSFAGSTPAVNVAHGTATSWLPIAPGSPTQAIGALAALPNGDLVASGNLVFPGGNGMLHVAQLTATGWVPLGTMTTICPLLLARANGDVIAGLSSSLQRWDGANWTFLTGPGPGAIDALVETPSGDVVAGGNFTIAATAQAASIARWTGTSWLPIGAGYFGTVTDLAVMPDGALVAGGSFPTPGGTHDLARWDGSTWSTWALPSGLGAVSALLANDDDDLIVGTSHSPSGVGIVGHVSRWNGSTWTVLGAAFDGAVTTLASLPGGDIAAGGSFTQVGGAPIAYLARWNGASWQSFGADVDGAVLSLLARPDGNLVAGGSFAVAGGAVSAHLAELTTTCQALVLGAGSGCSTAVLTADLAWTGATWHANASGLPTSALVVAVNGFAANSLPLASVFATALPGCTLHVTPDFVTMQVTGDGTAATQLVVPATPSLAGVVFRHQLLSLALDGTFAVTATNALAMTIGSF